MKVNQQILDGLRNAEVAYFLWVVGVRIRIRQRIEKSIRLGK